MQSGPTGREEKSITQKEIFEEIMAANFSILVRTESYRPKRPVKPKQYKSKESYSQTHQINLRKTKDKEKKNLESRKKVMNYL